MEPQNKNILLEDSTPKTWKKFNIFSWIIIFFLANPVYFYIAGFLGAPKNEGEPFGLLWGFFYILSLFPFFVATLVGIITLSYFGYAITRKKGYLSLGLMLILSFILLDIVRLITKSDLSIYSPLIGYVTGYAILRLAKNKLISEHSTNN